ncbi:MAG: tetratricopeptide repeat protein [Deltaproteobacteria bacterium]|nr:tetratricopeptide repeat protein [Deltaproteobacteria bacterium]
MQADVARRLLGSREGVAVKVGRFVVLELVGSGGMGVVYRAYDPELDRRVALKLLAPQTIPSEARTERLLREATALARLSHPNVVTVHEVGRSGDEVFVAMELVDGVDLGAWAREHPLEPGRAGARRFAQALEYLQQAGRGLAAAHQVDLVHRDFKPANVLIGSDGRIKVADFGLAVAPTDATTTVDDLSDDDLPSQPGGASSMTSTGTVLGTPRYMAPEQQFGGGVDWRADQFAFCVTAWEVLLGAHPWPQLSAAHQAPDIPDGAPQWVVAALTRGLRVDPSERHASMDALLEALRPAVSRWRSPWVVAVSVASLSVVATVGLMSTDTEAPSPCRVAAQRVDTVWNPQRRQAVVDALENTAVSHGPVTAQFVGDRLEDHAARWAMVAHDTCIAAGQGVGPAAPVWGNHEACLDNRLVELDALVSVLTEASQGSASKAVDAVWKLGDIDLCADVRYVTATAAPRDRDQAARVEALRAELAKAKAFDSLGRSEDARAVLVAALPAARELGHGALTAEILNFAGRLDFRGHSYDESAERLGEAFETATAIGYDHAAFSAVDDLIRLSMLQGRADEAAAWERVAMGLYERIGDRSPQAQSDLQHARGIVAQARGDLDQAREHLQQGVAALDAMESPPPGYLAPVLNELANVNLTRGDTDSAAGQYQRALELFEQHYGPEHPAAAVAHHHLGVAYFLGGKLDLAEGKFERALRIRRAAFGGKGPQVCESLTALANVYAERGDDRAALPLAQEAVDLSRDGGMPGVLALGLSNLSLIQRGLGDLETALATAEESLAIREEHLDPNSPAIGESLVNLAGLYQAHGDYPEAFEAARRSMAIFVQLGDEHPNVGVAHQALAVVQAATGQLDAARANYERAMAILPPNHPSHAKIKAEYEALTGAP